MGLALFWATLMLGFSEQGKILVCIEHSKTEEREIII